MTNIVSVGLFAKDRTVMQSNVSQGKNKVFIRLNFSFILSMQNYTREREES